jgi:hypothetical protein
MVWPPKQRLLTLSPGIPEHSSLMAPQNVPATDLRLWHFRVRPARGGGFIAWASKSPDPGDEPHEVPLGELVYYLLDDTEQQALHRLQETLLELTE